MIKKIRKNFNSFSDIILFLRIFAFSTFLPLYIKIMPLNKLLNFITPNTKFKKVSNPEELENKIVKFTFFILNLNILFYKNSCLKRSLILYHFFSMFYTDLKINLGVKYDSNEKLSKDFIAHAWISKNNEPYLENNEEQIESFVITYSFPLS